MIDCGLLQPYLLGNNENEQGYYKIPAYAQGNNLTEAQWADFLLADFTCPNSLEARNRVKYGVPTWQFRYFGDWDNIRLYPTSGAYHGSDLQMIFGGAEDLSGLPNSVPESLATVMMQHAWATFAEDPQNGLSKKLLWPQFDPERTSNHCHSACVGSSGVSN